MIQSQIDKHLFSGAISKVNNQSDLLLSRVFLVKKSNGKDRLIIDLSLLNHQIIKISFKMETHDQIRNLIEPLDFMASIDLSDAFFSIPIHKDYKKFLGFKFNNVTYQFNVLPFGLTSSPRIFSKVLKPAIMHLRKLGIKISFYLDDIFLCNASYSTLQAHINLTLNLLVSLGYFPNYEKSNLCPSRIMKHLGFFWDSSKMELSVPEEKVSKTKYFASSLLTSQPTLRNISSFLGLTNSLSPAFPFAPLHFRKIQALHSQLVQSKKPWNSKVTLDNNSKTDLTWWSKCPFPLPPSPLTFPSTDFTLSTDASCSGWGGVLSSGQQASGSWSKHESDHHINFLELKAIHFSFLSFLTTVRNSHVHLLCDNFTSVCFINKKGGTRSEQLCSLSLSIWELLRANNISCHASHIAGKLNVDADFLSRKISSANEYSISHTAFSKILPLISSTLTIDLFASRLNAKLAKYCSWKPDPFAYKINSFAFTWPNNCYMFPPINLISKCVHKLITDNVKDALLITPAWPGLASLPIILSKLINDPIFIPHEHLEGEFPTRHPFNMIAWNISSSPAQIQAYQSEPQNHSSKALLLQPLTHIEEHGNNFINSLVKNGHTVKLL